jgi:hypothetical protein
MRIVKCFSYFISPLFFHTTSDYIFQSICESILPPMKKRSLKCLYIFTIPCKSVKRLVSIVIVSYSETYSIFESWSLPTLRNKNTAKSVSFSIYFVDLFHVRYCFKFYLFHLLRSCEPIIIICLLHCL